MQPAKSHSSFPPSTRVRALTGGVRVVDVANACRSAALGFAWNGRHWQKRELARWLVGPYARAVAQPTTARRAFASGVARIERHGHDYNYNDIQDEAAESGVQRVARWTWPISADAIADMLESSHAKLLDGLRRVWSWRHDAGFARDMIDAGLVTGIVDDDSAIGYAPIDVPRMLLVDRVRSLFLADYLTRPRDYESFGVCPRCSSATFEFYIASLHGTSSFAHSHAAECARAHQQSVKRRDTSPFTLTSPPPPNVWVDGPESVPTIEVVGEIEIDIDIADEDEASDEDFDAFGDLRDTLIDPIEASSLFPFGQ